MHQTSALKLCKLGTDHLGKDQDVLQPIVH
jgi:hypothetical protein